MLDLLINSFNIYEFIAAYFVGLMFAFIGLIFMSTAQPALLYLCPMLIIASLTVSLIKRELHDYWTGIPV